MTSNELLIKNLLKLRSKCNGYFEREMPEELKSEAKVAIETGREYIDKVLNMAEFNDKNYACASKYGIMRGRRYSDDEAVLKIMISASTKIGAENIEELAVDALIDCMQADFWYEYEKDWG